MAKLDFGNPPITSTTTQPVNSPSTSTLCAELDSTQLGTKDFASGQTAIFRVSWYVGASTVAVWQLEQANSTALSASTTTLWVLTPTAMSGQYVMNYTLGKDDRLRARINSTFSAAVTAVISAERLT